MLPPINSEQYATGCWAHPSILPAVERKPPVAVPGKSDKPDSRITMGFAFYEAGFGKVLSARKFKNIGFHSSDFRAAHPFAPPVLLPPPAFLIPGTAPPGLPVPACQRVIFQPFSKSGYVSRSGQQSAGRPSQMAVPGAWCPFCSTGSGP